MLMGKRRLCRDRKRERDCSDGCLQRIGGESFVMERERKRLTREENISSNKTIRNTLHRVYTDRLSFSLSLSLTHRQTSEHRSSGEEQGVRWKAARFAAGLREREGERKKRKKNPGCIQVIHFKLQVESNTQKKRKKERESKKLQRVFFSSFAVVVIAI